MYGFFFKSCIFFVCCSSFGAYLLAQFTDAVIIPVACHYFQQLRHQAIWRLAAQVTLRMVNGNMDGRNVYLPKRTSKIENWRVFPFPLHSFKQVPVLQ